MGQALEAFSVIRLPACPLSHFQRPPTSARAATSGQAVPAAGLPEVPPPPQDSCAPCVCVWFINKGVCCVGARFYCLGVEGGCSGTGT